MSLSINPSQKAAKRIPRFVIVLFVSVITVSIYFTCYRWFISNSVTIVDTGVLCCASFITSIIICSFIRNPKVFVIALLERLLRPIALVLVLTLRTIGLFMSIFLRSIRIIFSLAVVIIYGVWPLDLIPDIFLGVGWLDDVGVTILAIYFGLRASKFMLKEKIKDKARGIMEVSRIKTNFP